MIFKPAEALHHLLMEHGLRADLTEHGISIPQSDLVLSADIVHVTEHADGKVVQLDVRVHSRLFPDRLLIESFSGFGTDESESAKNAFGKFLRASLHVLLAVLVERNLGADQVEWESWSFKNKTWRVCIGPLFFQSPERKSFPIGDLLDHLRDELLPNLSEKAHWFRIYFWRNGQSHKVSEVLLDNTDWSVGRDMIDAWDFPDGVFQARLFLMMIPV